MNRLPLTIPVTLALFVTWAGAQTHPLETATYQAMVLCGPHDQVSLESCGRKPGNAPALVAARRAVDMLIRSAAQFITACERTGTSYTECRDSANYHMLGGFNRAMAEEAAAQSRSTLQSSTQR